MKRVVILGPGGAGKTTVANELASHTGAFYALGDAIRLRPEGRLEAGDYDLRFALDPAVDGEPALVWFYRLRVR